MPPGYDLTAPGRPVRGPIKLLIPIIAAVVIAAVAAAIAINARSERAALLTPPPPVASTATRIAVQYDEATGVVSMPGLQATVPKSPFTSDRMIIDMFDVFEDTIESQVVVQKNYDGHNSWYAVVDAGLLDRKVSGKDTEETAEKTFAQVLKNGFSDMKLSVKNRKSAALRSSMGKAWVLSADVHYRHKGVKSSYDRVNVLVVEAGSGRYVCWLSDRPNKSDPAVKAAIDASIASLKVTPR